MDHPADIDLDVCRLVLGLLVDIPAAFLFLRALLVQLADTLVPDYDSTEMFFSSTAAGRYST